MADQTAEQRPDWRDRAPLSLLDPNDPDGEPCSTPMDRRWLWRLESFLAVSGTNDTLRQMGSDLRQYLNESCEHHWRHYATETDVSWPIPAHKQCLWCSDVEWTADAKEEAL